MENTGIEIGAKGDTRAGMAVVREMAGGVAHDLNNMLTGILGFIALMKDDANDIKDAKSYLGEIEKNANEIKIFADKLILLSMHDKPVKASFDINALIREVSPGPWTGVRGISYSAKVKADGTLFLEGDRAGLSYSFESIIRRLVKALSSGGSISVASGILKGDGAGRENISVRFSFSGAGMDREQILAMFEPAYISFRESSLGYELVLANETVRAHGGVMRLFFMGEGAFDLEISLPI